MLASYQGLPDDVIARIRADEMWIDDTEQKAQKLAGHTSWVFSVAFSPDDNFIVSGSNDKTINAH